MRSGPLALAKHTFVATPNLRDSIPGGKPRGRQTVDSAGQPHSSTSDTSSAALFHAPLIAGSLVQSEQATTHVTRAACRAEQLLWRC